MAYLKAVTAGLVLTVVAVVVWVAARLALAHWSVGSGGVGLVLVVLVPELPIVAALAFALGCWWAMRRYRRRAALP